MSEAQAILPLVPAPRPETVELLYRTFGDVLVPLDQVRSKYFRNLNPESFGRALEPTRIRLPVTTLDPSRKGLEFVALRHLAAYIDARAYQADEGLVRELSAANEPA